jgi:hypothetical protein
VFIGFCTVWMWAVLLTCRRYMLPPSSGLKCVGRLIIHVYIGTGRTDPRWSSGAYGRSWALRRVDREVLSKTSLSVWTNIHINMYSHSHTSTLARAGRYSMYFRIVGKFAFIDTVQDSRPHWIFCQLKGCPIFGCGLLCTPITAVAQSEAWNVFACSNTDIMGSNLTRSVVACQRFFCVCVVLYRHGHSDGLLPRLSPTNCLYSSTLRINSDLVEARQPNPSR